MPTTHQRRSYITRAVVVGGRHRTDFVLRCAKCAGEEAIHLDLKLPPDAIVKMFINRGWLANPRNHNGCFCPACASEKPKSKPEKTQMADQPKVPTLDQMKTIRDELRGCFDDKAGQYLDGLTDEKIGQRLSMPWSWVKQARDLFDLEIKVDPEILALRGEITALAQMLGQLDRKVEALEKRKAA